LTNTSSSSSINHARGNMPLMPDAYEETGGWDDAPLLLASPHSGRFYPQALVDSAQLPVDDLRRLEDPFVDLLLDAAVGERLPTIRSVYARGWIDLNRRETEIDPRQVEPTPTSHIDHQSPRVAAGLGLVPASTGPGRPIYARQLPLADVQARIAAVHRPYHQRITERLGAMHRRHGIALFLDIHSMPPLPASQMADLVIGDRHGRSAAAWLVDHVIDWLGARGYRVARNVPYAGGHGIERHGNPAAGIHAIQIEIDRSLYLERDWRRLSSRAAEISAMLGGLAASLQPLLTMDDDGGDQLAAE